ncbi:MAG TPA: hypothetical protein VF160_12960 [Candidatus Dormibacteraeota bacterium]
MSIDDEALRAVDPDTLLPGERESGQLPEDAVHWVTVYSELLATKEKLLANLHQLMERQSAEIQDELERADVRVIEAQMDRFRRRLEYWRRQLNR